MVRFTVVFLPTPTPLKVVSFLPCNHEFDSFDLGVRGVIIFTHTHTHVKHRQEWERDPFTSNWNRYLVSVSEHN